MLVLVLQYYSQKFRLQWFCFWVFTEILFVVYYHYSIFTKYLKCDINDSWKLSLAVFTYTVSSLDTVINILWKPVFLGYRLYSFLALYLVKSLGRLFNIIGVRKSHSLEAILSHKSFGLEEKNNAFMVGRE